MGLGSNILSTLVKVAECHGNLDDVMYSFNIKMLPYKDEDFKKYIFYENENFPYLVSLTYYEEVAGEPNLIFSITSYLPEINDFISKEFVCKTKIPLKDDPDYSYALLIDYYENYFKFCESLRLSMPQIKEYLYDSYENTLDF